MLREGIKMHLTKCYLLHSKNECVSKYTENTTSPLHICQ